MPFSALILINYFNYKRYFGLNRVLVCDNAYKTLLMPINGGLWESVVEFITQKFKYLASFLEEKPREVSAKYLQRLRTLVIGICETEVRLANCYQQL